MPKAELLETPPGTAPGVSPPKTTWPRGGRSGTTSARTPDHEGQGRGRLGGWGRDFNFVAPLGEADALVAEARAGQGIATIEERLGIPANRWNNPDKLLYRYILKDPSRFGLRVPSGREGGADKDEWVAGGIILGLIAAVTGIVGRRAATERGEADNLALGGLIMGAIDSVVALGGMGLACAGVLLYGGLMMTQM